MTTIFVVLGLFFGVQLLASLAVWVVASLLATPAAAALADTVATHVQVGIALLVGSALLSFGLWWWFYRIERPVREHMAQMPDLARSFRFKPLRRDVPLLAVPCSTILLAVCATLGLSLGLDSLLHPFHLSDDGSMQMFGEMLQNPLCWLYLCLVGPLTEELVFRLGVTRQLYRLGLPAWGAALVGALLFGVVHGNLFQTVPALVLGFWLGLCYLRTGRLRLSLAAHVANNTLSCILMCTPAADAVLPLWAGAAVSVAAVVLMVHVLRRRTAVASTKQD